MKKTIFLTVTALIALAAPAQTTLSLDEVKSLAVKANMKTRSAAYATAEAQEQKKEAFTNYFPTLSASSTALKANHGMVKVSTAFAGQPIELRVLDKMWVASVTAVQPVFMGGQIINGNKLAKTGVEASQLQENLSRNDVELTAENYYWQIVTLKEKEKTLESIATMLKSLEKDASLAVKAGVGLRNDLLQVQLRENEIESQKIKLDNGLSLCKMTLAQYIGMDGKSIDVSASADPSQLPGYPDSLKVDHEAAVANTNEYQLLQKNVDVKTLERKIEVGKNLPQVAVGASVQHTDVLSAKNNFGLIFAQFSIPISGWWGGSHAIKRKKLAEQEAREQLTDNKQLLEIRMQKDWNDVDDAYKQLVLAKKSINQSEENLRLNRDYYKAGTVNMTDLLNAQQLYQQARDKYTDAFADLQNKIEAYKKSTGQ